MAKEPRTLEALVAVGRPMTGIREAPTTTSLLLGRSTVEPGSTADDATVERGHATESGDAATGPADGSAPAGPTATETQSETGPATLPRTRRRAAADQLPTATMSALDAAVALLPADHEVLRSGTRRDDLPVRDVTYETPASVYFAFVKMKNDLARHTQRRITAPAVIEAAFRSVPEDIDAVEDGIAARRIVAALRGGSQRRLSVRVSEERYHWLQDLTFLLYERSGERVAGSQVLTLAICLLLETAGRGIPTFSTEG